MPRALSNKVMAGFIGSAFVLCLALYLGNITFAMPSKIQPCFKCEEYLNRRDKVDCPSGERDCGPCNNDYYLSEDGITCHKLELVESPPENVMAVEGGDITLACTFSGDAHCVWSRDDIEIAIGGRYRWTTHKDPPLPRQDCSLTITRLDKKYDAGRWDCRTQVSSSSNVVLMTHQVVVHFDTNTTHDDESTTDGNNTENDEIDAGLSTGAKVVIYVLVTLVTITIVVVIAYFIRKRWQSSNSDGKLEQMRAKVGNTLTGRVSFLSAENR